MKVLDTQKDDDFGELKRRSVHRDTETDPARNPVLRLVRRFVPSTDEYHGQRLWVKKSGKWVATPLFTGTRKRFIAGDPMNPATNSVAGRS